MGKMASPGVKRAQPSGGSHNQKADLHEQQIQENLTNRVHAVEVELTNKHNRLVQTSGDDDLDGGKENDDAVDEHVRITHQDGVKHIRTALQDGFEKSQQVDTKNHSFMNSSTRQMHTVRSGAVNGI